MTILKAFGILIGSIMLMGVIGGAVGYGLGLYSPQYYRIVFRAADDPQFDPVSMGTGLGIAQGVAGGAVVGLALLAILCWREVRSQSALVEPQSPASVANDPPRRQRNTAKALLLAVGGLFLLGIFCTGSFFVGALVEEIRADHRRYIEERDTVAPALADKLAFANVEIVERSKGGIGLEGEVATAEERDRLQDVIHNKLGEMRTKEVMMCVRVAE